jgi:hypothetical protein
LKGKIAVTTMKVIVHWVKVDVRKRSGGLPERGHTITSAEAGGHDGDLCLALLRGPQGSIINTKVLWAVEDSSTLLGECYGRHWGE